MLDHVRHVEYKYDIVYYSRFADVLVSTIRSVAPVRYLCGDGSCEAVFDPNNWWHGSFAYEHLEIKGALEAIDLDPLSNAVIDLNMISESLDLVWQVAFLLWTGTTGTNLHLFSETGSKLLLCHEGDCHYVSRSADDVERVTQFLQDMGVPVYGDSQLCL